MNRIQRGFALAGTFHNDIPPPSPLVLYNHDFADLIFRHSIHNFVGSRGREPRKAELVDKVSAFGMDIFPKKLQS